MTQTRPTGLTASEWPADMPEEAEAYGTKGRRGAWSTGESHHAREAADTAMMRDFADLFMCCVPPTRRYVTRRRLPQPAIASVPCHHRRPPLRTGATS
jgi:hypothetical protein